MLLVTTGLMSLSAHAKNVPPRLTAGKAVLITNTGSTNTTGYSITVAPSGEVRYRATGLMSGDAALKTKKVSKRLVQKLLHDLQAAAPLGQLPVNHRFKSISFGTSTFIEYKGQRTPDLSAPADARGQALLSDADRIAAALNLTNSPRRPVRIDIPEPPPIRR